MPHTAELYLAFLRRMTLSLSQERRLSGVLPTFSLPDRYAVKILSPIITNIFCFNIFEETISLQ